MFFLNSDEFLEGTFKVFVKKRNVGIRGDPIGFEFVSLKNEVLCYSCTKGSWKS